MLLETLEDVIALSIDRWKLKFKHGYKPDNKGGGIKKKHH